MEKSPNSILEPQETIQAIASYEMIGEAIRKIAAGCLDEEVNWLVLNG